MKPLTDEQRDRVADNLGLARMVIRKKFPATIDRDAAESDAFLGVIKAMFYYDPSRSKLSTLVVRCCHNEVVSGMRWEERLRRADARYASVRRERRDGGDDLPDFDWFLEGLPEEDKTLLRMRYHDGMKQEEISRALGCVKSCVSMRLKRIREKLAALLSEKVW